MIELQFPFSTGLTAFTLLSRYILNVLAIDKGSAPRTGTVTVTVIVNDLNDNDPFITHQPYETSYTEDSTIGTTVFVIKADDIDENENDDLTYALTTGHHSHFEILPDYGVIKTTSVLDRETIASYVMEVEVRDGGTPSRTATTTTTLTVLDVNDNDPVFSQTFVFFVTENVVADTFVGRVLASDQDKGVNAALQFSIMETQIGHPDYFTMDANSGSITTANDKLDREDTDRYQIRVRAKDSGTPPRYTDTAVTINIGDHNDLAPACENGEYSTVVAENVEPGLAIVNVSAMDNDIDQNTVMAYSLADSTARAAQFFTVDSSSGVVVLLKSLDHETDTEFVFEIKATDQGSSPLSTNCRVSIQVGDENDNDPVFGQTFYSFEAAYNENTEFVIGVVAATDKDAGDNAKMLYDLTGPTAFQVGLYSGMTLNVNNH